MTRDHRPLALNWLLVLCAALLLSVLSGFLCRSEALSPAYARAFAFELEQIIDKHPRYVWGGSESEAKGLDCSGLVFLAARRAGLPVRRTTSRRMSMGESGWDSAVVPVDNDQLLDLMFWTLTDERPNGHVGVRWRSGKAAHASSSRARVVVDKIRGVLKSKLSRVRRLTIGD